MAVTAEQFERFLSVLGPDRNDAGQRYEGLRRRLLVFFAARGSGPAEEWADETLDRAAQRVAEGVEIAVTMESYVLGIARNVIREQWKKPVAREVDWARVASPAAGEADGRLDCLDRCLETLAPQSREWVETFYAGKGGTRIRNRQALAERLGIDGNALRVRMHRIRAGLLVCMQACLDGGGNETQRGGI